ncbi:pollen receptor-like kinase 3 [Rutidosis leptorrhynchoides]|uniref:pollen receptor-like kinase 3 n=1 Tax=Rutidosis leptorrhynchoides TaxID=125765 RepID=UPI003A9A3FCD
MAFTSVILRKLSSFLSILLILFSSTFAVTETDALLKFKNSLTNASPLKSSWVPNSLPCNGQKTWTGIVCYGGSVSGLRFGGMGLSGTIDIDALLELRGLRTIGIANNNFSDTLPQFNRIGALRAMYLSGNQFSGVIPPDYFAKMDSLKKIWISNNNLEGEIPPSVFQLSHLLELHLENNKFSGKILSFNQPTLRSLNLSHNQLVGKIPDTLSKFNSTSFSGNAGLCGEKLSKACPPESPPPDPEDTKKDSIKTIAAVVTLALMLLSVAIILIIRWRRKKNKGSDDFNVLENESNNNSNRAADVSVQILPASQKVETTEFKRKNSSSRKGSHTGKGGGGIPELIMLDDSKGVFRLPDLMKAAAEVLGNGSLGSSYKAVMANGFAVVVKRMREMNALGKDCFDAEIKKIRSLKHTNIITPLAYHYRKDEKLMIYEHIAKGSLLFVLHGDRGESHAQVNWPSRLKIVKGIAKGLGYIHSELATLGAPHGNLKSSNILLTQENEPLLTDFGFSPMINPRDNPATSAPIFAYKSPEAAHLGRITPKCDVYCLGLVILEILTGKFPSQYGKGGTDIIEWVQTSIAEGRGLEILDPEIEVQKKSAGQIEKLIIIGAACAESNPDIRPELGEAISRIEEVQVEGPHQKSIEVFPSLRDGCPYVNS